MGYKTEEQATVGSFLQFDDQYRSENYLLSYSGGEAYVYIPFGEYEIDDEDDTSDDWWHGVAFRFLETIQGGPHHPVKDALIEVTYRDFPERITASDGTVVYPQA